jgi:hypothetical protein
VRACVRDTIWCLMGTDSATPCVCIVDAYSSGSHYPAELARRGFRSLHVQSIQYPEVVAASFHAEEHVANIVFDGDVDSCIRRVREFRPLCVIAATEASVMLADRLSEALGVQTNGTELSRCRRNKFDMQERVASVGVRAIPSFQAAEWAPIEAWLAHQRRFPVVLKPPASASTDHVTFCNDAGEARAAFEAIRGASVLLGNTDTVVVQPFVRGEEWCVQTVSCAGHHALTDIWREDKIHTKSSIIYDRSVLLPSSGPRQTEVLPYVWSVLDALGIRHGAAHVEVLVTDDGPVLVEIGARLCGAYQHVMCRELLGIDQLTLSVDAYLDPKRFFERTRSSYEVTRNASQVFLVAPHAGRLRSLPRMDDVRRLRSFFKEDLHCSPESQLTRTVDLVSSPGIIHLVHADPVVVEHDYRLIRAWEAEDFYDMAGAAERGP